MEKETGEVELAINENKTKYMKLSRPKIGNIKEVKLGKYTFEKKRSFKYLGIQLIYNNDRSKMTHNAFMQIDTY